ncbi:beta-lactamase/transpeptidase-like protein, partial [Staphylotrichum tortipilum]
MTPEFEALVKKAVEDGLLPNAVALARDKSGKMNYTFAHGPSSVAPDSPPITPSTLLTLASMTKLITTLSILQLIEAGSLTLDTDVTRLLPALSSQPVLSTPPTAAPTPRKSPITVRHLLTHTAGTGYLFLSPQLQEWAKGAERALPIPLRKSPLSGDRTVDKRFGYPLLFEPGSAWAYGSGLDWAGKLVEVVSGQKLG